MKNPLENNKFCTALIVLCNAILIVSIYSASLFFGKTDPIPFFYSMYIMLILGNILIRFVLKSGSTILAKNYLYIIVGLIILALPFSILL